MDKNMRRDAYKGCMRTPHHISNGAGQAANATGVWTELAASVLGCLVSEHGQEQSHARDCRLLAFVEICAGQVHVILATNDVVSGIYGQGDWAVWFDHSYRLVVQGATKVAFDPRRARYLLTQPIGNAWRQIVPYRRSRAFADHARLWIATVERRQLEGECPVVFPGHGDYLSQRDAAGRRRRHPGIGDRAGDRRTGCDSDLEACRLRFEIHDRIAADGTAKPTGAPAGTGRHFRQRVGAIRL